MRLEVDARVLQLPRLRGVELRVARCVRPRRQTLHIDQRVVRGDTGGKVGLARDADRVDRIAGRVRHQLVHLVEEGELDAAPLQHLVERREDGVAHAGLHLPHDGAVVVEGHAHHAAQHRARLDVRLGEVAAFVGEHEVVEAAHGRGVDRQAGVGAVAGEPGAEVLVVDGVEALREHAVLVHADERGEREIGADVEPPQLVGHPAFLGAAAEAVVRPFAQALQRGRLQCLVGVRVQVARQRAGGPVQRAHAGADVVRQHLHVVLHLLRQRMQPAADAPAHGHRRRRLGRMRMVLAEGLEPLLDPLVAGQRDAPEVELLVAVARLAGHGGRVDRPQPPLAVDLLGQRDEVLLGERVAPGGQRRAGRAVEQLVGATDRLERVVVEAEPDVQAVLLDALPHRRIAPAGALAAEAPALLVHGDLAAVLPAGLVGQPERRRHRGDAAADDGDLLGRHRGVVVELAARRHLEVEAEVERQDRGLRAQREAQRAVERKAGEGLQRAGVLVAEQPHRAHRGHLGRRGDERLVHRLHAGRIGQLLEEDLLDLHAADHLHDVFPAVLVELEEGRQVGRHQLERLLDELVDAAQDARRAARRGGGDLEQRMHRELRVRRERLEAFRGQREPRGRLAVGRHRVVAFVLRIAVQLAPVDERHAFVDPDVARVEIDVADAALAVLHPAHHHPGDDVGLLAPALRFVGRPRGLRVPDLREGDHHERRQHLEVHGRAGHRGERRVDAGLQPLPVALDEEAVHLRLAELQRRMHERRAAGVEVVGALPHRDPPLLLMARSIAGRSPVVSAGVGEVEN